MGNKLQHGHLDADDGGTIPANTIALSSLQNQSANKVIAGPASGTAGAVTARDLVLADIPDLLITAAKLANTTITNGKLSTSTGSAVGAGGLGVSTGQEYTFAPSITNDTASNQPLAARGPLADPGTTDLVISVNASSGTSTVRWRYINASCNPDLWVIADADGQLLAVWEAEDAPGGPPITLRERPDLSAVQVSWPDELLTVSINEETDETVPATIAADDRPDELPRPERGRRITIQELLALRMAVHPELGGMPRRCERLLKCFALRALARQAGLAPAVLVLTRYRLAGSALVRICEGQMGQRKLSTMRKTTEMTDTLHRLTVSK